MIAHDREEITQNYQDSMRNFKFEKEYIEESIAYLEKTIEHLRCGLKRLDAHQSAEGKLYFAQEQKWDGSK